MTSVLIWSMFQVIYAIIEVRPASDNLDKCATCSTALSQDERLRDVVVDRIFLVRDPAGPRFQFICDVTGCPKPHPIAVPEASLQDEDWNAQFRSDVLRMIQSSFVQAAPGERCAVVARLDLSMCATREKCVALNPKTLAPPHRVFEPNSHRCISFGSVHERLFGMSHCGSKSHVDCRYDDEVSATTFTCDLESVPMESEVCGRVGGDLASSVGVFTPGSFQVERALIDAVAGPVSWMQLSVRW